MKLYWLSLVVVLMPSAMIVAQEVSRLATTKVDYPHGTPDESLRDAFSLSKAARSIDQTALTWIRKHQCGSCHTGWPYLMARAVLKEEPSSSLPEIRAFFEGRIVNWDADEAVKKHQHREIVGTSTALAIHDAQTTGKLHPITREALDRMWTLQRKDGAWSWPKCSWPPFEVDDYFGALLAAVGVANAPEDYWRSESAKVGVEKLRTYFAKTPAPNLHHRTWLLWASVKLDGLLNEVQQQSTIQELLALQRSDGGWSMESLGKDWVGRDGEQANAEAPSDGYGTGLVVYVLRQAGLPTEHASIQKGRTWLATHQRESGRWFTRSLNGVKQNYISDTGTVFAVLALASSAPTTANPPSALQAGAAAIDVTPQVFPLNMPGGFSENLAHSAHDPLHARCLALNDGKTTIAMVVLDSLGAAPEVLEEAKRLAFQKTNIPTDKILICSTHTHSGPPSSGGREQTPEAAYRERLIEGLVASIVQAHAALKPASVGAASHPLPDEVFNRRWYLQMGKMPLNPFGKLDTVKMNPGTNPTVLDRPAGPTDPDITILSVQDDKRKPLALFANYSLHYVGGMPPGQISADYFGEFARLMPSRLSAKDDFVAMMSNGTSGDINNIPFLVNRPRREPFEQIRIVAQKSADAAWFAHQKIERHRSDAKLGMIQREVTLNYRRPTAEQVADAETVLALKDKEAIEKLPRLAQNYARNVVRAAERKEATLSVQLQAIRIGDLAVCGIPFETFAEIGLELKERSPFPLTMVIGLANGRYGYLPTPAQHRLGGYETWLGTNSVQEDTSEILTENLLEMLAELKDSP